MDLLVLRGDRVGSQRCRWQSLGAPTRAHVSSLTQKGRWLGSSQAGLREHTGLLGTPRKGTLTALETQLGGSWTALCPLHRVIKQGLGQRASLCSPEGRAFPASPGLPVKTLPLPEMDII